MKKKKPIYKRIWFWILVVVVAMAAIGSLGGNGSSGEASGGSSSPSESAAEPIEYVACTVDDMMALLEENALSASDTYKDQYVEVTGRLSVIDSNGKYVSIYPMNNDFAIIGVHCNIKNDEQLSVVKSLTKGQTVTVKGKIKDVGEVMGYTLDIDSIG